MGRRPAIALVLAAALVPAAPVPASDPVTTEADDVVVVAVVDTGFTPYHWDFAASKMPQQEDQDPDNDLPLDRPPHEWLPGFPAPESFKAFNRLDVTLDHLDPDRNVSELDQADISTWNGIKVSTDTKHNYYWLPGTKVIGLMDFDGDKVHASAGAHGAKVSSVATGNIHGTCPECLLVFVALEDDCPASRNPCREQEFALEWAERQPWIDVVTNSYGFSAGTGYRDRLYSGSDVELQRTASERGQTVFFSAGNGLENDFRYPNTTYFSSQEGPDWIVTVAAVSAAGGKYTGTGKPADIAGPGEEYPSAGGGSVTSSGEFGGTSNATPVNAGLYAHALYRARKDLEGPSRIQSDGVVAAGDPLTCGPARTGCELGDGLLTATELRTRFLEGAVATDGGVEPGGHGDTGIENAEYAFMAEGHGTYWGRMKGDDHWREEADRIFGPMTGASASRPRPDGEREWMIVDSYCRQSIWGEWSGGYYDASARPLPLPDPRWPVRTALQATCGPLFPPV